MKVNLDSRLIKSGEYFVPVKGESFDGHNFINRAIANGAAGIIEEKKLYDLVKKKIKSSNIKIIGVTGSNGKTTVSHLTAQLLSNKFAVAVGKQNTKLGLAVDFINNVDEKTQVFVAEIGMDRLGEISEIVGLFPLDIAVITTINPTHLEKLKTLENITKAKFEIAEGLRSKDSVLILNSTNETTREFVENNRAQFKNVKVIWFGDKESPDLTKLNLLGEHNRLNMLAVVEIAESMGMTKSEIDQSLSNLKLPKGRLSLLEGINGSILIDDTYNANPISTISALDTLNDYHKKNSGGRKVAILGSMLELAENEMSGHVKVAEKVTEIGVDVLVTVGELAEIIYDSAKGKTKYKLGKSSEFGSVLDKLSVGKDVILIKGSQSIRMEKITEMLMKDKSKAAELLVRQDRRWKEKV